MKKTIKRTNIEMVQDSGNIVICDFIIYKEKNPELFTKKGRLRVEKLKVISNNLD